MDSVSELVKLRYREIHCLSTGIHGCFTSLDSAVDIFPYFTNGFVVISLPEIQQPYIRTVAILVITMIYQLPQ